MVLKTGKMKITWNDNNQSKLHSQRNTRSNLGTACYHSFQNILSSHSVLNKNVGNKMYETVILSLFLVDVKLGLSP